MMQLKIAWMKQVERGRTMKDVGSSNSAETTNQKNVSLNTEQTDEYLNGRLYNSANQMYMLTSTVFWVVVPDVSEEHPPSSGYKIKPRKKPAEGILPPTSNSCCWFSLLA
jgi:hypothetical protein